MPIRSLLALGVAAVLTGCMPGTGSPFGQTAPSAPPDYIFPALAEVQADQIPPELSSVAGATARRLLGRSSRSVRRAVKVRNAGIIKTSKDLPLDGYALREIQFLESVTSPDDDDKRETSFNLLFVDGYGRDAAVRAVVGYTKTRGGIALTHADWTQVSMPLPHFDTFVVPADQSKRIQRAARTWRGLYDQSVKRAIPLADLAAKISQGGEFLVISIGKRPVGNDAKLTVELAESKDGPSGTSDGAVRNLVYPGRYVAMVLPVKVEPGGAVWGRIVHTPGNEVAARSRKPTIVDLFQLGGQPSG